MPDHTVQDPYHLDPEAVEDPPHTFGAIFRRIGPGLILASAIVGSGELIATTVLGAENGYSLLWLILLSCTIKIVVQNELGRYAIATGETTLEAFDRVPGPRWQVSWVVWLWFVMVMMVMFAVGGMMGAISEVLNSIFPAISINVWVWIVNVVTVILLVVGRYALVEKVSMGLVVAFTILTVSCAVLLFKRPEYFSWTELGSVYSHPELIRTIVEGNLRDLLIGEDPLEVERIWEQCDKVTRWYGRKGAAMSALGGVDTALWGIRGKTAGKPVY